MGADGSLFATRRALYPCVPEHLLDDFIVSMSVVFEGYRLVSAPDVHAYEKSAAASADEFRRKRRIACRAYSSHRHIWPMVQKMVCTNRFKYVSHRIIRWYGAAFGGASVLFGVVFMLIVSPKLALAGVALGLLLLAFCRWSKNGLVASLTEIGRALFATMLGVVDSWRGKRYQTWQPVQGR
jgi:cellulose synthase/poly-beta-1,6-N-acetylglucosamine synthase-like glycosyltransferase